MGLLGRSYLSVSVTEGGEDRPLVAGTRIRMELRADSVLAASAGCNQVGGPVSIDDGTLSMNWYELTQMGCDPARHAQDEWLVELLRDKPTWRLEADLLTLARGSTTVVLQDLKIAEPDLPVEGTKWTVESVVSGWAFERFPGLEPAYLVIEGDQATGSTGCNGFTSPVTRSGSTLTFGPLTLTTTACSGEPARLQQAVLANLKGTLTYTIDFNRLELRAPDNKAGLNLRHDERLASVK